MHEHARWIAALLLGMSLTSGCTHEKSGLGRASDIDDAKADGGDVSVPGDAAVSDDDAWTPEPTLDAGPGDASTPGDAGAELDAAVDDAGPLDAAVEDAGSLDGGSLDGGSLDGGSLDAGLDAGRDASVPSDAGAPEDGSVDPDAGTVDPVRCPGREHVGDVVIRKAADVALLDGVVCLRGHLTIAHELGDPMPLPLGPIPDLRIVFGDVTFGDDRNLEPPRAERLERIEGTLSLGTRKPVALPALVSTGALMIEPGLAGPSADIELPALREVRERIGTRVTHKVGVIRLPALERVGGTISLGASPNLRMLHVPNLRSIEGDFRIKRAPLLGALSFPALEQVQAFSFTESTATDALRSIELPALQSAARIVIDSRTAETLRLPRLERVEGLLSLIQLNELRTLDLAVLAHVQTFHLLRAWLLAELALPALSTLSSGILYDCPQLSECVVPALNAQLAPGSGRIRGDGLRSDPSCAAP